MTISAAYQACLDSARRHYENFPVASWLVPLRLRGPIAAIYAFARRADDLADEGQLDVPARLESLKLLRNRLHEPDMSDAVDVALSDTIRRHALPKRVLERLLDAFESDVQHTPFTSWDDVLTYCSNSADPVGELLLRLDHSPDEPSQKAIECSNAVCTALQITNFLQDISLDIARGRQYIPVEASTAIRRTYELFTKGCGTTSHLRSRRLRLEVALTIAGGVTMLDLCASRTDASIRPALGIWHVPRVAWRLFHVLSGKPLEPNSRSLRHDLNS
ncbi:MAG: squalene synthase HpnC [Candidatus Kapabacteria bacterium]|nr:squalene synthase HpnC [Candidatus Kapabacteria bacterium]